MTLNSMTGFARCEGEGDTAGWVWEMRAVNGKGLDVRLRLPPGMERLEQPARKLCSAKLNRGNVQAGLTINRAGGLASTLVNEESLTSVLAAIARIESQTTVSPSSAAQILALRGVLETAEPQSSKKDQEKLDTAIMAGLEDCLIKLNESRATEGQALADILLAQIGNVETLTARAEADPSHTSAAIAARLQQQLDRISSEDTRFDATRLHQEVALLATKADIREELDRLIAHTASARDLIGQGSPVGRKLEFLAQEFNRESNTLCSKSNAVSLTEIGLELKVVIDQFREQTLNVE